ncbi:hypothetical protein QOT17_013313 [Balamuthia mandrillaris]
MATEEAGTCSRRNEEGQQHHTLKAGSSVELSELSPTFTGIHLTFKANSLDSAVVKVKPRIEKAKACSVPRACDKYVFLCKAVKPGTTKVLLHRYGSGALLGTTEHHFEVV